MPVALVVVLLMTDGTSSGRAPFLDTLARSLDPNLVQIQPRVMGSTPPAALERLSEKHPVVEVRWQSPTRVEIRAALKPHEWTKRTLTFSKRDPMGERAKVIAFTVAAMMPQWRPENEVTTPPVLEVVPLSESDFELPVFDAGTPTTTPAPVEVVDAGTPVVVEVVDAGVVEVAVAPPPTEAATVAQAETPSRFMLSALLVGGVPLALGGGGLDAAWCPLTQLCVGAQSTISGGAVTDIGHRLEVRTLAIADLRVYPWNEVIGLTARAGGGAHFLAVYRGSEVPSRWTGAGLLEAGAVLRLRFFELSLAFGCTATGPTTLFVNDVQVSAIAPFQATGRLGASFRF